MSFRIGPQVAWQIVEGEAIVVDLDSGLTIGLNPTGTFIWSQLQGRSESEIAAATAKEFEVEPDGAMADVHDFVEELRRRRLIVEE